MGNNMTNKRIDELDYIRGFALLGIILVNILALLNIKIPDPNTVDASYQRFLYLFVEGRFFSIFSFLFGVGFYIFISRAIAKGKNGYVLFFPPLSCTIYFRFDSSNVSAWEALALYAICGLIVLPFYKAKKTSELSHWSYFDNSF
ncbi:heparan-alpha-glucosaminide N-acetyltransferase domain-containing protein [Bacillus pacificus]